MENLRNNWKALKKDLQLWYTKLEKRGRILVWVAVAALIWLILQFVIGGIARQTWFSVIPNFVRIPLNILCVLLVALVIGQFYLVRSMLKEAQEQYQQMMVRGRRDGGGMNITGTRPRTAGKQGKAMSQMAQALPALSADLLDKQYRPKPLAKPTLVKDWKEVAEGGVYALESNPKAKIEIIDAADIGGGYFIAYYQGGMLKERTFYTAKNNDDPVRFDSLRNAKKVLDKLPVFKKTTTTA